uniref:non-specific serine/threonine protein kinase n=1 Tax=viral metagenome TaxID=1070528 RepID=A0A6C0DA95_9ZZZZ
MSSTESEYNESLSDDDLMEHEDNLELKGLILNKYNIITELGRGSYSIVWLGYNIENAKYYAIKVQNPREYKEGISENKFMKKLPKGYTEFNKLIDEFVSVKDNKNFLCSVYDLHYGNLDTILRKGKYQDGMPYEMVKPIMIQILKAVEYMHNRMKVCHADIKSDNILIKGINKYNSRIIELYDDFKNYYSKAKTEYTKKLTSEKKHKIRSKIHGEMCNKINEVLEQETLDKYSIDDTYLNDCKISLADFGSFVEEGEYYDESFGTRYYRSPENILIGKSSFPNDIWAVGCTFYELLTGRILFDPDKDKNYDRDFHHLKLINEVCGDFPYNFLKKTKLHRNFFDKECKIKMEKDLSFTNKIENKLSNILDPNLYTQTLKLIKGMLEIDPHRRLTATECLNLLIN